MIVSEKNIEKAKQLIKKADRPIILIAQDEHFNRKMLEYGRFDVILSIEKTSGKSSIRQNDSGFNHVLGKIATKNNVALGINLEEIINLKKEEKAERLVKIIQNIELCRKTKTKIAVVNVKEKIKCSQLLLSLGASTLQVKETLYF